VVVASGARATRGRVSVALAAGVLVGLSALIRVPNLALLVLLAPWVMLTSAGWRSGVTEALALAGAGLVTFLVGCIASDASWQQMVFNAVQVHAATPVDQPWHQRLDIGRELFSDVG